MQVRVVIIEPPGWDHAAIFADVAELLARGFTSIGHAATVVRNAPAPGALNVVLAGFHLAPAMFDALPPRTVFYNLEQVDDRLFDWMPSLKPAFERFEVWDYSQRNIVRLRPHAPALFHLPIGTVPELTRIEPSPTQDIDVLFYGALTDRRRAALDTIRAAGLKVEALFGVYGRERDARIARAKVVLNLHKHDAQVFEIVRVSYLLANRKAVVSEIDQNTEIEPDLADAVYGVPYDEIARACRLLVDDDRARAALQERAYVRMTTRNEAHYLRKLLGQRQKAVARRLVR